MTTASAETLGLRALHWLASRADDLERFLATSGLGPQELRRRASEQGVLAGVLGYVLAHEALAASFSADEDIPPREMHAAHHVLSGER